MRCNVSNENSLLCCVKLNLHKLLLVLSLALAMTAAGIVPIFEVNIEDAYADPSINRLFWWGMNAPNYPEPAPQLTPDMIAAGLTCWNDAVLSKKHQTSFVITSTGELFAWGSGANGSIGDGTSLSRTTPISVPPSTDMIAAGVTCWSGVSLSHSQHSTFALAPNGTLFAWGNGDHGRLGIGEEGNRLVPTLVPITSAMITAGVPNWSDVEFNHQWQTTFALAPNGTLWSWGNNAEGRLGSGSGAAHLYVPTQVLPTQAMIDAGVPNWSGVTLFSQSATTFALAPNGTLWAWGHGGQGRIGNGTTVFTNSTPVQVPFTPAIATATSASSWNDMTFTTKAVNTFALAPNGTLLAWGGGSQGTVGNGLNATINHPAPVPLTQAMIDAGASSWNDVVISQKCSTTFAITPDGSLFVWGRGDSGRFGFATDIPSRYAPYGPIPLTDAMIDAGASSWNDVILIHRGHVTFALINTAQIGVPMTKRLQMPSGTPVATSTFQFSFERIGKRATPGGPILAPDPIVTVSGQPRAWAPPVIPDANRSITINSDSPYVDASNIITATSVRNVMAGVGFNTEGIHVWEVSEVANSSSTSSPSSVVYSNAVYRIEVQVNRVAVNLVNSGSLYGGGIGYRFEIVDVVITPLVVDCADTQTVNVATDYFQFTNTYRRATTGTDTCSGALSISKTVDGGSADVATPFNFDITITATPLCPPNTTMTGRVYTGNTFVREEVFTTGVERHVVLLDNQRLVFPSLIIGTTFAATERAASGFIASVELYVNGTAVTIPTNPNPDMALSIGGPHVIADNTRNSADFTNIYFFAPPMGLFLTSGSPYLVLLAAGLLTTAYLSLRSRKRIDELPIMH